MPKALLVTNPDKALFDWQDLPAALGLLTRLPVRVDGDKAQARGAAVAWAYPVVGLVLGCILILAAMLCRALGIPVAVTALLLIALNVVITGGLHEDGLADSADGLWGGWDKARRLEIMKDSRIGAYGVLALIIGIGLRWACLTVLVESNIWLVALLLPATLSRTAMVAVMAGLKNARDDGLSQAVGRPSSMTFGAAFGIAAVVALSFSGDDGLWLLFVGGLTTGVCAAIARQKIGGQTGDILGATQQVTEIAILIVLASAVT